MQIRLLAVIAILFTIAAHAHGQLQISPPAVLLDNPEGTQQVLVRSAKAPGDLTRVAKFQILDPKIATVDDTGLVEPKSEGTTALVIRHGAEQAQIKVEVKGLKTSTPVSFEMQIMPILSKLGCNAGSCHGKAEGQNGFKLSVFGFDPAADHEALVKDARGRRVLLTTPDTCLMLLKATGQVGHRGGRRTTVDSRFYHRLHRWITEGVPGPLSALPVPPSKDKDKEAKPKELEPTVTAIEVEPKEVSMVFEATQQLRATAIDSSGKRFCITMDAEYDSNAASVAKVDGRGLVRVGDLPGQAAILVRYLGHVTSCRVTIPRPHVDKVAFVRPPEANFIDKLAWDHLAKLNIPPTELADDATFLRRVSLDLIGTLPTAAEARAFLADKRPNKRALAIDQLLERPEYADYWAMFWSDLLRVDRDAISPPGAVALSRWLRKQFAENRPYDQFVHEILTARGSTLQEGPAALYRALTTPEDLSRAYSQLFLGVRIQCAQCHHHPSDRWGQEDYFALAGMFTGMGRKRLPGGSEAIVIQKGTELQHPRTKKPVPAAPLGAKPVAFEKMDPKGLYVGGPLLDRRAVLAQWTTAADNGYFAKAIANRLWSHYFGRGLVEPLDDLRATNPATNEPLMNELAKHMRDVKFDLKKFTRTLLNSRLYQLSSRGQPAQVTAKPAEKPAVKDPAHPPKEDVPDEQNFSHASPRAIPAEVLLDAISQATGVPEKFNGWPEGYRAIQVWDNRMPSYFFRIFGRPVRASVCECERSNEPSIAQALHLMNSDEITAKIHSRHGAARRLARSKMMPAEIIDELYLGTLTRFPTAEEKMVMLRLFEEASDDRQGAVEDVLWALMNSRSFVYNH